jgi:hypothetical protein
VQQDITTEPPAARQTECFKEALLFQDVGERKVVAEFNGGRLSSDGGVLLLRQVDAGLGVSRALAGCFTDLRRPELVEHRVEELVAQRLQALALGYEDLNDHQLLRRDALLAVGVGKVDVLGAQRREEEQVGIPLASAATLNRLELSAQRHSAYHKLPVDPAAVAATLLRMGVRCLPVDAEVVVLDFDATHDPLHGQQEGRFFRGHYDEYCYLPLFCFCGEVCLWAQLRTSDHDASDGVVEALAQIVAALRERLPHVKIIVRADSGFAREELFAWCEAQPEIYFCVGLARNERLEADLARALMQARAQHCLCGGATVRVFQDLTYRTRRSWTLARRVIGKAEVSAQGPNPRFIVTNVPATGLHAADGTALLAGEHTELYEELYCGRGQAENQIKQMTLDLQSGRTSTHYLRSNQLRLWLSAFAYLLLERLRALGLRGTELARAHVGTLRRRLLKVAALITVSVRRVYVQLSSAFPLQRLFARCHEQLRQALHGNSA